MPVNLAPVPLAHAKVSWDGVHLVSVPAVETKGSGNRARLKRPSEE